MDPVLHQRQAFEYFRMGLVTGIVDKHSVVEWADREILQNPIPEPEMIELSLSGSRPYSQLIWLLNSFQGEDGADYDLPLKLLFARAGILLDEDPGRARAIILGLRLLKEEEYLPKDIQRQLSDLESCLDLHQQALLSSEGLAERLSGFFDPYMDYRPLASQLG